MQKLPNVLQEADQARTAIGHFNISESVSLTAVAAAARELNVPVIVGLSEGERKFFGTQQAAAVVRSIRDEYEQPIYLNADHTHSLEGALEAARAGFDAVVFDRSSLPFEENIRETRRAVEALKSVNPNFVVEGEIGDIGTGSQIHDKAPDHLVLTTVQEAKQFVDETGVDVLSPAVGNMHGMLKSMIRGTAEKRLNLARIKELKQAVGIFMTLHGGSGTNDADLREAILSGMTVIHINTELRVAWRKALDASLAKDETEVVPYKLLAEPLKAVQTVVRQRLELFNSRPVIQA
ncbi:MAG TPA: class II fructose-bisphosphate aldolase [Pseudacidobacterium sp.]|jgi:fructose-bisphosphate aldolase class II|nr:class II fructose-bisphosphate aldolase [Pseudacidobacterium sp.]